MAGASGRFERVRDPMEVHVRSLVDLAMVLLIQLDRMIVVSTLDIRRRYGSFVAVVGTRYEGREMTKEMTENNYFPMTMIGTTFNSCITPLKY